MLEAWGKYDRLKGQIHPLAHHCADVASVFESLMRRTLLRDRLECAAKRELSICALMRLAVLCFLHDAGKLHPGFQAKRWNQNDGLRQACSHALAGAELFCSPTLRPLAEALGKHELLCWGVNEELLLAILSHHGRPLHPQNCVMHGMWHFLQTPLGSYNPALAANRMGESMHQWFAPAFETDGDQIPTNPEFVHLFCGVLSLADWIGSDRQIFEFSNVYSSGYIDEARKRADSAVARIGLDVHRLQSPSSEARTFQQITGFDAPNAHQTLVGILSLDDHLVILEAETGSGKTEAALWRFERLFTAGKIDSLYFALPTRAAAIQLHARVQTMLNHCWHDQAPEAVLAIPGYMKAGTAKGIALPNWKVLWDDVGGVSDEQLATRWAAESSRRYLAATVAVGTVDQAMLGALQVKHAHLRSAALSRSLLVIDEVHASDAYMTRIQNALLRTHLQRGGYALLMSATLGSRARELWLKQQHSRFAEAVAVPYPAVWSKEGSEPLTIDRIHRDKDKRVRMHAVGSMNSLDAAKIAAHAAERGARVLVIRNTVTTAIETWEAVQAYGMGELLLHVHDKPALHHSRFAPEDRRLLDRAVEDALGRGRPREGGRIVVGTQTLEQSLDIDADLLITDLCPVDVLLQRIGRLHRHAETRRPAEFAEPHCHVMMPENGLEPLLEQKMVNGLGGKQVRGIWCGIYSDLSILELTRRLVAQWNEWVLPSMNRMLVESATHRDCIETLLQELGGKWRQYQTTIDGFNAANRGAAGLVLLHTNLPFSDSDNLFPSDEESIRTRLGVEGARVEFTAPVMGPFGALIQGFVLPEHWSHGIAMTEPVSPEQVESGLKVTVGQHTFHYDLRGITKGKS